MLEDTNPKGSCMFWIAANLWFSRFDEALRVANCLEESMLRHRIITRINSLISAIDDPAFVKDTVECGEAKPKAVRRDKKTSRIRRRDGKYFITSSNGTY